MLHATYIILLKETDKIIYTNIPYDSLSFLIVKRH